MNEKVFVGIPNRGVVVASMVRTILNACEENDPLKIEYKEISCSIHTYSFNLLYANALNMRKTHGVTHFCLHHSDIRPENYWLTKLMAEKERVKADVISVVAPIKDKEGVTSCGLYNNGKLHRFTMDQIVNELPPTFDAEASGHPDKILLLNTGLMLFDIREPWAEQVFFSCQDNITKNKEGEFQASCFPEDWNFSLWAHNKGLKTFNTSAVKLDHVGDHNYSNDEIWEKTKCKKDIKEEVTV